MYTSNYSINNVYQDVMLWYYICNRGTVRGTRGRGRGITRRDLTSLVSYKGRQGDGDGWNKVKLLNASRYDKTDVLQSLVNAFKEVQPLSFQKQGMNYVFYVDTRVQVKKSLMKNVQTFPLIKLICSPTASTHL